MNRMLNLLGPRHLRLAEAGVQAAGGVARRIWTVLRILGLEVTGFLFLALAGWGALWLLRTWRAFQGDGETLFKMTLVAAFVAMMAGFGISSFWRARRLSRSRQVGDG